MWKQRVRRAGHQLIHRVGARRGRFPCQQPHTIGASFFFTPTVKLELTCILEPLHWNIPPMVFTPRKDWAVHPWAIKWIFGKFYEFDAIRGPEGVGQTLHDKHLHDRQLDWTRLVQGKVIDQCLPFNWECIAGCGASEKAITAAKKVFYFVCSFELPKKTEHILSSRKYLPRLKTCSPFTKINSRAQTYWIC